MSESNMLESSSVVLSHSFGVLGSSGSGDIVGEAVWLSLRLSLKYQGTGASRAEDVLELLVKSGVELLLVLLVS